MEDRPGAPRDSAYDERRLQVLVEYSASLRWQMLSALVVMGLVAWTAAPAPVVLAWAVTSLVCREVRAARLQTLPLAVGRPIERRLREVAVWSLALGLANGSAALFMLWLDTAGDAVITMILVSLAAGAVSTTFTVLPAFVAYAAGIVLPSALMWLARADAVGLGVGMLSLMFLGVQIRFARQNQCLFAESYAMRLENRELLAALSEERTRLAQARDAAVEADKSKSRFLAAASHDLRQPLQSLSLNVGALSRMPLDRESHDTALEIAASIEALGKMLDGLLDVSKLDSGEVAPVMQPLRLDRLLDGLVRHCRSAAAAKGLRLELDCPPELLVRSDAEMLQRIVANVIDNAIKFTTTGGVFISAARSGGRIALSIRDTGMGIPAADQKRIFDDLVQLGNARRDRAAGHGLGLGIVRRLAHLLDITYSVDSVPGTGTCFHLALEAARDDAPTAPERIGQDAQLSGRRVLVLDDDPAVRAAYERALCSRGCVTHVAATREQALALLLEHGHEIAVVDYRLDGAGNGLAAIRQMRERNPALAAVLVTADTSLELRELASRLAVPVLRKPVSDAALTAAIDGACREMARPGLHLPDLAKEQ